MTRQTIAFVCLGLLTAWIDGLAGVAIPYNHPANPYARSAPPITVPRIRVPNVKDVTPDPATEEPEPHPGAAAPKHRHEH